MERTSSHRVGAQTHSVPIRGRKSMGRLRDRCKLRLSTSRLEFLEWMNSQDNLNATPVPTLSSSSEPSELERAHLLGVSGYRSKHGNVAVLVEISSGVVKNEQNAGRTKPQTSWCEARGMK